MELLLLFLHAVAYIAKVRILKQITTGSNRAAMVSKLLLISQR